MKEQNFANRSDMDLLVTKNTIIVFLGLVVGINWGGPSNTDWEVNSF